MRNNPAVNNVQPALPQPYVTPQLTTYGSVRDLTAGGSGNASENNMGGVKPKV